MGKIADATFSAGGQEYAFGAYSTDTSFKDISAVYIFTKRTVNNGTGSHSFLYIGETSKLGSRIENHEKWGCVNSIRLQLYLCTRSGKRSKSSCD